MAAHCHVLLPVPHFCSRSHFACSISYFNNPSATSSAGTFTGYYYANATSAPGFTVAVSLIYAHSTSATSVGTCTLQLDDVRPSLRVIRLRIMPCPRMHFPAGRCCDQDARDKVQEHLRRHGEWRLGPPRHVPGLCDRLRIWVPLLRFPRAVRSRRLLRGGRSSCHVPSRLFLCRWRCGSYALPCGHLWQCDWPVKLRVLGAVPVL